MVVCGRTPLLTMMLTQLLSRPNKNHKKHPPSRKLTMRCRKSQKPMINPSISVPWDLTHKLVKHTQQNILLHIYPHFSHTLQTLKGKKPEIASVIAPYQATSPEQLSLQRGQLIMIRKKTDSGWWEGELQAKGKKRQVGWFPASYVKVLNSSGRVSGRSTPVSTTRLQQEVVIGEF